MFKDASLQEEIAKNGFAVADANLLAETQQLKAYISTHFKLPATEFYYSLLANSATQNKILQGAIHQILHKFYEATFSNYRVITESFLAKPANTTAELLLHQDWCYTDEKQYAAYNIWLPLVDVTEANGAMFFLRGSHLWFNNIRSATLPTARISISNFAKEEIATVALKRGQALLFHPAVFHGSYPNLSSGHRIITTATVLPKEAPFLYYQKGPERQVEVFQMRDDAFLNGLEPIAVGGRPSGQPIRQIDYLYAMISAQELKEKVRYLA
jgi:hypothetical protein